MKKIALFSWEYGNERMKQLEEQGYKIYKNLQRFLKGDELINLVDIEKGY